jgi:hypothetical protein
MSYQLGLKRASDQQKQKLIAEITPGQSGNDSKFKEKLSEYTVTSERLKQNAAFVGRGNSSVIQR